MNDTQHPQPTFTSEADDLTELGWVLIGSQPYLLQRSPGGAGSQAWLRPIRISQVPNGRGDSGVTVCSYGEARPIDQAEAEQLQLQGTVHFEPRPSDLAEVQRAAEAADARALEALRDRLSESELKLLRRSGARI